MPRANKSRPAMEIGISSLGDGDHPFLFDVLPADIGLDESFVGNVRVEGNLRKVSTQFFMESTIAARCVRPCDRCLKEFERAIDVPMTLYYRVGSVDRREQGDEDADIVALAAEDESIVLDDDVRQSILLDLPLKELCGEDCKGLCAGCGADLNTEQCGCQQDAVDPRWEKLAEVFRKNNN